jgi:hypothetical protein
MIAPTLAPRKAGDRVKTGWWEAGRLPRANASSDAGPTALPAALFAGLEFDRESLGKLKLRLRAAKASTAPALDQAIADLLPQIAVGNAGAWFRLRPGPVQK